MADSGLKIYLPKEFREDAGLLKEVLRREGVNISPFVVEYLQKEFEKRREAIDRLKLEREGGE